MSKQYYIIPIFVPHKGCPYDCIFCNQKRITGFEADVSPEQIRSTIESYIKTIPYDKSPIVEIAFFGGSFTAIPMEDQTWMLKIAKEYIDNGYVDHIRLSTRPDYINVEILNNLKKYAVSIIELGIQSMDEEVLKLSRRGHSTDDVMNAIQLIKNYGFTLGVQIMVGLPGDNEEKCVDTAQILSAQKPDFARIYPALVIKDTEMEGMYKKNQFIPLSLDKAVQICKKILIILEKNNIQVIRVGLQPTENIELEKDVIAGPFHPSMRQLVESSLYKDMMASILAGLDNYDLILLKVNPKDISYVIGQNKSNIKELKREFSIKQMNILQDNNVEEGEIIVNNGEDVRSIFKKDYYNSMKN